MKKFVTLLIITFIFFALPAKLTSVTKNLDVDVTVVGSSDKRVKALQSVFTRYNSPLLPYASTYVEKADKYGIDWKLLPSIAGLESSFGKRQMPGSHNSYGWGGGHIYFDSYEHGIDTINKAFKERYAARGATTVESIGPIYAESKTWVPRVKSFMSKFEAELAHLELTELELTI
jgi:hypothetical protein